MKNSKGFGIVGILITVAIIAVVVSGGIFVTITKKIVPAGDVKQRVDKTPVNSIPQNINGAVSVDPNKSSVNIEPMQQRVTGSSSVEPYVNSTQGTANIPADSYSVSVHELNAVKEKYTGQTIQVRGRVRNNKYYSEISCPTNEVCNTLMGGDMLLVDVDQPTGPGSSLLVLKNSKHILCDEPFINQEKYVCVEYEEGEVATLVGEFTKDREPTMFIGPKVVEWRDIYYLNIK